MAAVGKAAAQRQVVGRAVGANPVVEIGDAFGALSGLLVDAGHQAIG